MQLKSFFFFASPSFNIFFAIKSAWNKSFHFRLPDQLNPISWGLKIVFVLSIQFLAIFWKKVNWLAGLRMDYEVIYSKNMHRCQSTWPSKFAYFRLDFQEKCVLSTFRCSLAAFSCSTWETLTLHISASAIIGRLNGS